MSNVVRMGTLMRTLSALKAIEALTVHSTDPLASAVWKRVMPVRTELEAQLDMFSPAEVFPDPAPTESPS